MNNTIKPVLKALLYILAACSYFNLHAYVVYNNTSFDFHFFDTGWRGMKKAIDAGRFADCSPHANGCSGTFHKYATNHSLTIVYDRFSNLKCYPLKDFTIPSKDPTRYYLQIEKGNPFPLIIFKSSRIGRGRLATIYSKCQFRS